MFTFYSALIVVAIFAQLIMLSILETDNLVPQRSKIYFKISFIAYIFVSLFEWIYVFFDLKIENYLFIKNLSGVLMRLVAPAIPLMIGEAFSPFKNKSHLRLIIGINTVLQILSLTSLFYIELRTPLASGNLYIVYELIFLYCFFSMFFNIYTFCKKHQSHNLYIIIMICIIMYFTNICQLFYSEFNIAWLSGTLTTIFLYVYYFSLINKLDPLTKLLNRRCYEYKINSISKNCAILILDVNKFKYINDTYGHSTGDLILKELSEVIKQTFSQDGYCFRTGGDEFCILLQKNLSNINNHLLDLNKNLSERRKSIELLPSISVGYAYYYKNQNTIQQTIELADSMMYKIKEKNNARALLED